MFSTCAVTALFATAGCGGSAASYAAPASPEQAIAGFLAAVQANSQVAMGELWGTSDGPAASRMSREELEKRLTVIRAYLVHDAYTVVPGDGSLPAEQGERIVQVRLERNGCTPVVPFTVVRYGRGWLVKAVDLEAAGNPQRRCTRTTPPA